MPDSERDKVEKRPALRFVLKTVCYSDYAKRSLTLQGIGSTVDCDGNVTDGVWMDIPIVDEKTEQFLGTDILIL